MTESARLRLFDPTVAFAHPATPWLFGIVAAVLVAAPLILFVGERTGRIASSAKADVLKRYYPWLVIVPALGLPLLLGAFWVILGVWVLAVFCFREYARATGLFRERFICLLVGVGMAATYMAALDNWYRLFVAAFPLTVATIAGFAVVQDRPKGYIQRVALGVFAFALFGNGFGHLAYLANDEHFRPLILLLVIAVELNDVGGFTVGRLVGGRKLSPNTSPNKTISGAVGGITATTLVTVAGGLAVFAGGPLADPVKLVPLGVLLGLAALLGDLTLSSIKRDVGVKDMAALIPGHGGLLDRFDSLLLAAPVAFHVVNYFAGVGAGQTECVFSGARGP